MKKLIFRKSELFSFLSIIIIISELTVLKGMTQENQLIKQEINISEMVIKEDSEALQVDLTIPVIQGLMNKKIEKQINQTIQDNILNFKYQIQNESVTVSQEGKSKDLGIYKYIAEVHYLVHYQSAELLSLSIIYYGYTGGAHGYTIQESYNFNLKNGVRIALLDILKGNKDYFEIINQEIKRQILLDPETYFDDAINHSINEEQPFYIVEDGIVIYFGLYEIAPYSSGIRYFKIPFSLWEK